MIYALTHYPPETIGYIGVVCREMTISVKEVQLFAAAPVPSFKEEVDGVIVMGGPMSVDDTQTHSYLKPELQFLEACLVKNIPMIGMCLGAQLIAKAAGAKVYPHKVKEVGWHPIKFLEGAKNDPNLLAMPSKLDVLQWHGDTFDLPQGSVHLAKSEKCENQAFRLGRSTYGFQFHLEATAPMVKQWAGLASGKKYIEEAGEKPEKIMGQSDDRWQKLRPSAFKFFATYFRNTYQDKVSVY